MTAAGDLDKRIELLAPTSTPDSYKQRVPGNPESLGFVWAKIRPLTGREYRQAEQTQSDTTHEVTIRYRKGLTAKHLFRYKGRLFELTRPPINLDEADEWLVLECKESQ